MRRLLAWSRKEAREHRAFLRWFHVALPALVLLAAMVLKKDLRGGGSFELASAFAACAVMLSALGVAVGFFASDVGDGTASAAQRLPGAMRVALVAKLVLLLVTSTAAAVAALLWTSGAVWLLGEPEKAWKILTPWAQRDGLFLAAVVAEAFAFAGALALVACWVRRPAPAVAGGVLLAAVFVGANLWAAHEAAYAFALDEESVLARGLGAFALVLVALAWSWLGGRRLVAAGWGAAVRGLAVLGVAAGASAVSAAQTFQRWQDVDLSDPTWRLQWGQVAPDGTHMLVHVARPREHWPLGQVGAALIEVRHVDLERGSWHRVAPLGVIGGVAPLWQNGMEAAPQIGPLAAWPHAPLTVPREDRYDEWGGLDGSLDTLWIDVATGKTIERQPVQHVSSQSRDLLRRLLGSTSPVRDSQGRRTFLHEGFLEREDGVDRVGVPAAAEQRPAFPIRPSRAGWAIRWMPGQFAKHYDLVDPDTGAARRRVQEPEWGACLLSRRHLLRAPLLLERPGIAYGWELEDLDTGEKTDPQNPPEDRSLHVVTDEQLLVSVPVEGALRLCTWNPLTGERAPLAWDGEELRDVTLGDVKGPDRNDRWLLRLHERSPDRRRLGAPRGLAVLDMRTRRLRLVSTAPEARAFATELLIRDDGALLRIEREREIVQYGPEAGRREVLFPRRAGKE